VPGRTPLVVDRRSGAFYEESWLKLLRRPSTFVMIETWNEFHEGTEVCESREYGRQYIELTRRYADLFHQGYRPPPPRGPYTDAEQVRVVLSTVNAESGLRQLEHEDGLTAAVVIGERPGRTSRPNRHGGRYVYFVIDDSFKPMDPADFVVEIDYWDGVEGWIGLEFDGSDTSAPFSGAYSRSPDRLRLKGSASWVTGVFHLPGARLLNGQNGGADFRLVIESGEGTIAEVRLSRR
jgi:hypothetical protein